MRNYSNDVEIVKIFSLGFKVRQIVNDLLQTYFKKCGKESLGLLQRLKNKKTENSKTMFNYTETGTSVKSHTDFKTRISREKEIKMLRKYKLIS